ncbi:mechanosensitive ion channel family protein [Emticicia agri]|uniref:Mechanosensitive ion channel n=1 Tax=Emticicia agri TaxID=2492393 RepID=A0A4V1ZD89_9BACT|nr:mechanosensitive ion channel [Emticicia agri]RYU95320.1 mechanosensitive ion channel [Emticicia agri]
MDKRVPSFVETLMETFNNLIKSFMSFIYNLIGALAILIIGWLVAKAVAAITKKMLQQIGADRIGEKLTQIEPIKSMKVEIKISTIISKILYYFILIFILRPAADTLGVPAISDMVKLLVEFIPKMISAGIMLFVGIWLADTLRNFVVSLCKSFNIAAGKLIGTAVFFFLLIIFVIQSVAQVGINTSLLESSFNLFIGGIILAFAIGYGFASKEILLNIISSFYSKNKYKEGQVIEIDGVKGEIIAMDNTSLTIQTQESKTVFPLQVLQSKKIVIFD